MSNSDELRHTENTTLVPPRFPDTLLQVYHRIRPTLGLLILPSVSPFPLTIRHTARISIPPIKPNLAERARISAINLDDYQLDSVTPPPSPSSLFTMAVYQQMIAKTDPTQREEALIETGQNLVPAPETALTDAEDRASNAQEEARQKRKEALEEVVQQIYHSEVTNDKSCSKNCLKNYEALKKQYDDLLVKLSDTDFKAATYKRGLATLEGQIVKYREHEVLFSEEIALLKRSVGSKEYHMGLLRAEFEKVKEEKEGFELKIAKFDKSAKDLEQLLGSQITDKSKKGFGYNAVPSPHPLILNRPTTLDLSYSSLEEFKEPLSKCAHKHMAPRAVLMKTGLKSVNTARPVNTVRSVNTGRPFSTARPFRSTINTIKARGLMLLSPQHVGFGDPSNPMVHHWFSTNIITLMHEADPSGCSRHMTGNIAHLSDFKDFDGGLFTFGRERIRSAELLAKLGTPSAKWVVAEMGKNRTVRIMDGWRDEAVSTACYVQNRVLIVKPHNKTPYELFRGFKPAIGFMKPFGCHVTILNTLDNLGKFDGKSDEGIQGVSESSTSSQQDQEYQDCIVMPIWKDASYFGDVAPRTIVDAQIDDKEELHDDNDATEKSHDDSSLKDNGTVDQQANTARPEIHTSSREVSIALLEVNTATPEDLYLPLLTQEFTKITQLNIAIYEGKSHQDLHTCLFACFLSQEEPKRVSKALSDPAWVEAIQEELLQFKLQKVWILVDLPKGHRAIGTKWVYRNKKDERGIVIRNKARLVTQEEGIRINEILLQPLARN
ncbi:retrovirus-related pol polyprotein from transposon TNT 1-94 [Tanacetum coccineum]